ncbi:hypothetical protein PV10_06293 [Exophiala mesophila]|uniref:Glycosyl transferase CAP10 domain-containing protein n=2 Tax=Exophiala mesophila TaxID=212818 RepID=A0A0D1ZCW2_EXOME|nr:uncharacterized protein PV10_06293 [Exophiala mesophila]KIV91789.1 hypothetical protein PV10_06293 [Exophiala mesophila]
MGALDTLCCWISILTAAALTALVPKSTAHDRPIHILVVASLACAFALPTIHRLLPNLFRPSRFKQKGGYNSIPLASVGNFKASTTFDSDTTSTTQNPKAAKVRITVLAALAAVLSLRLEVYRRITKATECTITSVEVFLPFLLAAYDALRSQKNVALDRDSGPDATIYQSLRHNVASSVVAPRFRYLLPVFLICCGCYLVQSLWASLNSTYICPITTGEQHSIPALQLLALFLDVAATIIAYETSPNSDGTHLSPRRYMVLWSSAFLSTSVIWLIVGCILYVFKPELRTWLFLIFPPIDVSTILAAGLHTFLFCILIISTLHSVIVYGLLDMYIHLTLAIIMVPVSEFIWSHKYPFPPTSKTTSTIAFALAYLGWYFHRHIQQSLGEKEPLRRSRFLLASVALFLLLLPTWRVQDFIHYHPIDMLIYDAQICHNKYLQSVGNTTSLEETVARYQKRYNRLPPPGFDLWFEYAKKRSAFIVDEFDQIHQDLEPFWKIPPHVLRKDTWIMVSNPWNEISGISIRQGQASVLPNVLPTHKWMLDGVAVLINKFAEHLPDMDLAFNLNDEARVAVPYGDLEAPHQKNQPPVETAPNYWYPVAKDPIGDTVFKDMSFRNTFREFGSVGCPPSSYARSHPHISSRSHICHECTAPHSLGQFLANWTGAADICHQPDLAYLNGFYLSPAAFKTSHQLMPVFSQSKPHGYNDILYPSAWNYMDKVKYSPSADTGKPGEPDFKPGYPDVPFKDKQNVLFWRGATSEGVSSGDHSWRGMTRQRLVHMANNLTTSAHDYITILLPHFDDYKKYKYVTLPGTSPQTLGLKTDIAIVDRIARCGGIGLYDCTDQEKEFGLVGPSNFQAHWQYKFLFDLDGAGFSGRFLAFLESHSLPFKTALFREWYDSRIRAWHHFVPQDPRLHGVWSTLAYFAGVNGTLYGDKIWWKAHEAEAERIAEQGRDWVNKAIRKEDMEIYFFRLLLEWARITNDSRDKLGFTA